MTNLYSHNANKALTKEELQRLTETEWLVTNGLGGYASGTAGGALTRVFHGYLIAALPSPLGRTMMLNDLLEEVVFADGRILQLNGLKTEEEDFRGSPYLTNFRLDVGLPVWTFEVAGLTIEKRVYLPHRQNTTYINYRIAGGGGQAELRLRPAVNMREHEAAVNTPVGDYTLTVRNDHYELKRDNCGIPPLRLMFLGKEARFSIDTAEVRNAIYDIEQSRGYTWRGDLWSPGYFSVELSASADATLVMSTETLDVMSALDPKQAWDAEHDRKRRLALEADPQNLR